MVCNSFISGFTFGISPFSFAFIKIPNSPTIFIPLFSAIILPFISSIIKKSAWCSMAKAIASASASPLSNSFSKFCTKAVSFADKTLIQSLFPTISRYSSKTYNSWKTDQGMMIWVNIALIKLIWPICIRLVIGEVSLIIIIGFSNWLNPFLHHWFRSEYIHFFLPILSERQLNLYLLFFWLDQ